MDITSWVKMTYTPNREEKQMDLCFYIKYLGVVAVQSFDLLNNANVSYVLRGEEAPVEEAERILKGERVEGVLSVQKFQHDRKELRGLIATLVLSEDVREQYQALKPLLTKRKRF